MQVFWRFSFFWNLSSRKFIDYRKAVEGIRSDQNRYPKKEAIYGLEGLRTASQHVPDTAWLEEFSSAPGFKICLSHHPSYHSLVPKEVDLILSGHLHGSQWRYYSILHHEWRGVFNPDEGWFPTMSKGVYGRVVVSAGLSNTAHVPRICNPTEIVYLESP